MNRHVYRTLIPKHSFQSMSPADNPFLALDKENFFHNFSYDILEHFFNQIMGCTQEEENNLLLIDDYVSELKYSDVLKLLNTLVNNRHHLCLSIWMA